MNQKVLVAFFIFEICNYIMLHINRHKKQLNGKNKENRSKQFLIRLKNKKKQTNNTSWSIFLVKFRKKQLEFFV